MRKDRPELPVQWDLPGPRVRWGLRVPSARRVRRVRKDRLEPPVRWEQLGPRVQRVQRVQRVPSGLKVLLDRLEPPGTSGVKRQPRSRGSRALFTQARREGVRS